MIRTFDEEHDTAIILELRSWISDFSEPLSNVPSHVPVRIVPSIGKAVIIGVAVVHVSADHHLKQVCQTIAICVWGGVLHASSYIASSRSDCIKLDDDIHPDATVIPHHSHKDLEGGVGVYHDVRVVV